MTIIAASIQIAKNIGRLLKRTFVFWQDHNPNLVGASIAFYVIFSLGPVVVVTLRVVGFLLGQQAIEGQLVDQLEPVVGQYSAEVLTEIIKKAKTGSGQTATLIASIPMVLFGAVMIFYQLRSALNFIWQVKDQGPGGIKGFLKSYLFSFLMLLIVLSLLLLLVVKSPIIAFLSNRIRDYIHIPTVLIEAADYVATLIIVTVLFGMIYKVLPARYIKWTDVAVGAAVTSFLFTTVQFILALYIGTTDIGSAYGAIGSFTILVIWVFYSSQVFLFGAVFTRVFAGEYGSEKDKGKPAVVAAEK